MLDNFFERLVQAKSISDIMLVRLNMFGAQYDNHLVRFVNFVCFIISQALRFSLKSNCFYLTPLPFISSLIGSF